MCFMGQLDWAFRCEIGIRIAPLNAADSNVTLAGVIIAGPFGGEDEDFFWGDRPCPIVLRDVFIPAYISRAHACGGNVEASIVVEIGDFHLPHSYTIVYLFFAPLVLVEILWMIDVELCALTVVTRDDFYCAIVVDVATPEGMASVEGVVYEVTFIRSGSYVARGFVPNKFVAMPRFDGEDFVDAIAIEVYCICLAAFTIADDVFIPRIGEGITLRRLIPNEAIAGTKQKVWTTVVVYVANTETMVEVKMAVYELFLPRLSWVI